MENRHRRVLPDILKETDFPAQEAARRADLHGAIAFPISTGKSILGIIECFISRFSAPPVAAGTPLGVGHDDQPIPQPKRTRTTVASGAKDGSPGPHGWRRRTTSNNLLTIINSWAELLMDEPGLTSRAQRGMAQIKDAGNKATGLTRQLLAFTRHQIVERQPLNLNDRVSDIVELMKRVLGEDIQLVLDLDPMLGRIKADPGQIEQVVMNLVVNARDAMPHGGRLELETGEVTVTHRSLLA